MTWFAAHIVIGFLPGDEHGRITVWENVVLLEAESRAIALSLAEGIGKQEASLEDGMRNNDVPVKRHFAGVRKIGTISNLVGNQDSDPPSHGSEITYSEFEVDSYSNLIKLGNGEELELKYSE